MWEDRVSVAPFIPRQCMERQLCAEPIPDTGDTAETNRKGLYPYRVTFGSAKTDNRHAKIISVMWSDMKERCRVI